MVLLIGWIHFRALQGYDGGYDDDGTRAYDDDDDDDHDIDQDDLDDSAGDEELMDSGGECEDDKVCTAKPLLTCS